MGDLDDVEVMSFINVGKPTPQCSQFTAQRDKMFMMHGALGEGTIPFNLRSSIVVSPAQFSPARPIVISLASGPNRE